MSPFISWLLSTLWIDHWLCKLPWRLDLFLCNRHIEPRFIFISSDIAKSPQAWPSNLNSVMCLKKRWSFRRSLVKRNPSQFWTMFESSMWQGKFKFIRTEYCHNAHCWHRFQKIKWDSRGSLKIVICSLKISGWHRVCCHLWCEAAGFRITALRYLVFRILVAVVYILMWCYKASCR